MEQMGHESSRGWQPYRITESADRSYSDSTDDSRYACGKSSRQFAYLIDEGRRGLRLALIGRGCLLGALLLAWLGVVVAIYDGEHATHSYTGAVIVLLLVSGVSILTGIVLNARAFFVCTLHLWDIRGTTGQIGKGEAIAGLLLSSPIPLAIPVLLVQIILALA
jgi:hypothetical protein